MAVKCLTNHQKNYIVYYYQRKNLNQKELAEQFGVSQRTINRVLIEAGVATPVARIQGEAYTVMQLLHKHQVSFHALKELLESANAQQAA